MFNSNKKSLILLFLGVWVIINPLKSEAAIRSITDSGDINSSSDNKSCWARGFRLTKCPDGTTPNNTCLQNEKIYIDNCSCIKSSVNANEICDKITSNGHTCYINCKKANCSNGGYVESCPSGQTGTAVTYKGLSCQKDCQNIKTKTCADGGFLESVPVKNKCTAVTYEGLSCQKDCQALTCADGGYVASCPSGQKGTAVTYEGLSCQKNCKKPVDCNKMKTDILSEINDFENKKNTTVREKCGLSSKPLCDRWDVWNDSSCESEASSINSSIENYKYLCSGIYEEVNCDYRTDCNNGIRAVKQCQRSTSNTSPGNSSGPEIPGGDLGFINNDL